LYDATTQPRFVLVLLLFNNIAIYNSIKTVVDTEAGIHIVCVVGSKFVKTER
jgi:eukaryotic translation initiation factor 2C